MKQTFST